MERKKVNRFHDEIHLERKIIYYVLGILEALFAFRLIFKLLGANPGSAFVSFIYTVSGAFLAPFMGIFRSTSADGGVIHSILETNTIVAMVVYALIAWGIVELIEIYRHPRDRKIP